MVFSKNDWSWCIAPTIQNILKEYRTIRLNNPHRVRRTVTSQNLYHNVFSILTPKKKFIIHFFMYVVSNQINYEYLNIKIIKIYRIKKWLNNYNNFIKYKNIKI